MPIDAADWARRYFDAWKTNDRELVESLFTEDAVYYYGPFRPPARGRAEIARRWVESGSAMDVRSDFEVVAVAHDVAVIHWAVTLESSEMDGILIVTLDGEGR